MYIAMNRFKIRPGNEDAFEAVWRERERHLDEVPGYVQFHLLKGPSTDESTLYASHTVWRSEDDFVNWTKSEAFRKAHSGAGTTKDLLAGPPQFEGFQSVIEG